MADMIRRDTAIDELERIRHKLWEIDIPSPTVPEYIEHHEQVQSVMKAVTESVDRIWKEPAQPHTYRGVTLNDVMMYFDSLEGNEDAWTEFCSCLECRGWGLYHIRSATDKNVGTTDARQAFMDIVYAELEDDPDNNRANRIIWAADEYVESAQLGTNLAEVGTEERTETHACDCIDRQAALDIFDDYNVAVENGRIEAYSRDRKRLCDLPPAQPKHPDCAKCKSELSNKIRGQQDNPGMLTENDKGRNWGLEWAAQIVEGKRR